MVDSKRLTVELARRPHIGEGGLVRHKSCREEEPETATHSLMLISTPESGIRSFQL